VLRNFALQWAAGALQILFAYFPSTTASVFQIAIVLEFSFIEIWILITA
jgi:hypothetical protein